MFGSSPEISRSSIADWGPAFALVLVVVQALIAFYYPMGATLIPCIILAAVWSIWTVASSSGRGGRDSGIFDSGWYFLVCALLFAWVVSLTVFSQSVRTSIIWSFSFLTSLILLPIAGRFCGQRCRFLFDLVVLVLTVAVGFASMIEAGTERLLFLINDASAGELGYQHWSTFRSYVTFGHPLVLAAFLATTSAYLVGRSFELRPVGARVLFGCSAVIGILGIGGTGSRAAVLAMAVGLVSVLLVLLVHGRMSLRVACLVLGSVSVVGTVTYGLSQIARRSGTVEGDGSAAFRFSLGDVVLRVSRDSNYLGSGPGTASSATRDTGFWLPIENSFYLVFISLGVVGLFLTVLLLAFCIGKGVQGGHAGAVGGAVAVMVMSAGFNLWESFQPFLVVLGLLLMLCQAPADGGDVFGGAKVDAASEVLIRRRVNE